MKNYVFQFFILGAGERVRDQEYPPCAIVKISIWSWKCMELRQAIHGAHSWIQISRRPSACWLARLWSRSMGSLQARSAALQTTQKEFRVWSVVQITLTMWPYSSWQWYQEWAYKFDSQFCRQHSTCRHLKLGTLANSAIFSSTYCAAHHCFSCFVLHRLIHSHAPSQPTHCCDANFCWHHLDLLTP